MADKKTLTSIEAAEYIGMSEAWLRQSRMAGKTDAPPFLKIGNKTVRYLIADLDGWLEARRKVPAPVA